MLFRIIALFMIVLMVSCGGEAISPEEVVNIHEKISGEMPMETAFSPEHVKQALNRLEQSSGTVWESASSSIKTVNSKFKAGVYLISKLPPGVYVSSEGGSAIFKLKKRSKTFTALKGKITIYNMYTKQPVQLLTANENQIIKIKPGKKVVFDAGILDGLKYLKRAKSKKNQSSKI